MDRVFNCNKCPKTFKLNYHLQRHEISCKGFQSFITCPVCEDLFKSERTLKTHKLKCKETKVYNCDICDKALKNYSELQKHRKDEHSKIECNICEEDIYFSNMKRHMKVHKNETPATSSRKKKKKKEMTTRFPCEICQKFFFDKSTLNRHSKTHNLTLVTSVKDQVLTKNPALPVEVGDNTLVDHVLPQVPLHKPGQLVLSPGGQDVDGLEELLHPGEAGDHHSVDHAVPLHNHGHMILPPGPDDGLEEPIHPGEVGGHNLVDHALPLVPLHNPCQLFLPTVQEQLHPGEVGVHPSVEVEHMEVVLEKKTEEYNIENNRSLDLENLEIILAVHKHMEALLLTLTNRGQAIQLAFLKTQITNIVKKHVSDEIIRAILSIHPEAYSLYVLDNIVHIELLSATRPIVPKMLEDRRSLFKDNIRAIYQNGLCIVKLIDMPVTKSVIYKSALDIINENIIQCSSSSESEGDEFNDNEELSRFERLSMKIKQKQLQKARRDKKLKDIDWQKNRLPDLARKINSLFIRENKSVLNILTIYTSLGEIDSDFQRLVSSSKGWLTERNGWIRKKPMDINIICSELS